MKQNNTLVFAVTLLALSLPLQAATLPESSTYNLHDFESAYTETTAVVRGCLAGDGGEPCKYRFRFWIEGEGDIKESFQKTPWLYPAESGDIVHVKLTGLQRGTRYYYALELHNSAGYDVDWRPRSFATRARMDISSTLGGSVTQPGEGIMIRKYDEKVPIVATPDGPEWVFDRWTGWAVGEGLVDDPTAASTFYTAQGDTTLKANFLALYTTSSTGGGAVIAPGEGDLQAPQGAQVVLVAQPANEFNTFVGWTGPAVDVGLVADPDAASTLLTVSGGKHVTANFIASHTVSSTYGGSVFYYGGSVVGPGEGTLKHEEETQISLVAQANDHAAFTVWTGTAVDAGLVADPNDPTSTLTVMGGTTVTANFEIETIYVDPDSDLEAALAITQPGGRVEFAAGTYALTAQIEIQSVVTYQGAGSGLTIIDGNHATRAFVAWGVRGATNGQVDENGNGVPNTSGPTDWVLDGFTVQNCVADTSDRQDILSVARDLLNNYADTPYTLVAAEAENVALVDNPDWFDVLSGSADDALTDAELQVYLDTVAAGSVGHLVANDAKTNDGGAMTIDNGAVGTIQNCKFLNNYTPAGGGDDGGAINITGLSVVTINNCLFDGNYAVSPDSVAIDGSDGDAGHIKVQGNTPVGGFLVPGTTLICNGCVFLNGNAEDDAGALQVNAEGVVALLNACWFEGNTAWDNGTVLQFPNEDQHEVTVTNCVFANNISNADNSPDRMIEVRRNTKIVNCTFVGNNMNDQDLIYNNANSADGDNDGEDDEAADATQVVNCLFVNNVVGNGDDVLGSRNANFTIAATNCLFFGNTLQNGEPADNTQRPDEEKGSVDADPLLDDAFTPGGDSPAIDAGVDPAIVGVELLTDYDGDARPQGLAYDIGADEK